MMSQEQNPKYVHFANGFPPKELIPAQGLSSGINMHGGVFVGLHEEATSRLTRSQRIIPPLAKGRANYYPVKHRISSGRYREKTNPFDVHKGTEKTGFTPQVIKRSKPKLEKTSPKSENHSSNPTNNYHIGLKLPVTRQGPVSRMSTLMHGSDVKNPTEGNYRILCDIEKEITQNELQGIDEVYKQICNGSMESLCSLISPVKGKQKIKQASNMHYIQTSSSLSLTTKPLQASQSISTEGNTDLLPEKKDKKLDDYDEPLKNKVTKESHSILVPLPYFTSPSRPPYTAPGRSRENHNRTRFYASRTAAKQRSGAFSSQSLSGWSSPSVINFNATELPRIARPATRACGRPTGSIIGVQNRTHTGKVAIVASVDAIFTLPGTPPTTAASEFNQQQIDIPNKCRTIAESGGDAVSPESINSDKFDHNLIKGNNEKMRTQKDSISELEEKNTSKRDQSDVKGNDSAEELSKSVFGKNVAVAFNVIDETGSIHDVEIYNPLERDLQKQEQVSREIQKAQDYYQKRKQEIETLLYEHESIVLEVNNLSKE